MQTSINNVTFQRQKLESVGLLSRGIAHDFNNLLSSILASTELAMSELNAGLQPIEEIRNIHAVAIRASEIVRQLITYASQESRREPLDFSQLVQEMLELLKISIAKHAVLKIDLGTNLLPVLGNAPQLRQVVMNLILNASEAIAGQGAIEVGTRNVRGGCALAPQDSARLPEGEYLRLEVADTGRGMTEEQQARLFNPFFTTKIDGHGLGLAVVLGIVHAHGGAVHVVSAPGCGSSFQVFLPCVRGRVEYDDIKLIPDLNTPISPSPKTVLLVEDEELLRSPVAKVLRRHALTVVEAGDGTTAIAILRAQIAVIDIVLLDVTIPGASSLEVLREARRLRPDLKVILTSAYAADMLPFPPDAPAANAFLRKPFQLNRLVQLIRDTFNDQAACGQG